MWHAQFVLYVSLWENYYMNLSSTCITTKKWCLCGNKSIPASSLLGYFFFIISWILGTLKCKLCLVYSCLVHACLVDEQGETNHNQLRKNWFLTYFIRYGLIRTLLVIWKKKSVVITRKVMNYSYPLQSHRKCFILQHQQYTYFHVTETHKVETLFSNRWIFSFHQASFTIFFF